MDNTCEFLLYYWKGNVLILSDRAIDLLKPVLKNNEVEILPLECKPNEYGFQYSYNVANIINVIDCFDAQNSKVTTSDRLMRTEKYAFYIDKLEDVCLFKIPEETRTSIYATDSFVEVYKKSGLEGLSFRKVFPIKKSIWPWKK